MSFVTNYPIVIPFIVILAAEVVKVCVDYFRKRSKVRFFNYGGMPSGHSAFVSALVVVVAYREGIDSTLFMIAAAFALIVMYDAINLRSESGKHAKILNKLSPEAKLEESIGHTKLEVIGGAVFGAVIAFVLLMV
ncbi:divergent PAP2 family protein [Patescibacteria group bacterium]|nr:divergent PAP2 family protein [Patescibacteria group bacterium]MBU1934885.1 divergent PAP2 family protein [Patescibacteria group bacterium]